MTTSAGELALLTQINWAGLPQPEPEYRFAPPRRWRFDFAWPQLRVAVEVEGGSWTGGRHTRGAGFLADLEKYNAAQFGGWAVYRVTTGMVDSGLALRIVERALQRAAGDGAAGPTQAAADGSRKEA